MNRKGSVITNERGSAGTKAIIAFVILGVVVYAAVTLVPIYAARWKFEDTMNTNILYAFDRYKTAEEVEKGLNAEIYKMLDEMGAKYDKKKDVKVTIEQGRKKIIVDVWYERQHKIPFFPKRFHTQLENTPLKGL